MNSVKRIACMIAIELVAAAAGCGSETADGGGTGGVTAGAAGAVLSGGSGGKGGGQPGGEAGSGGTRVDAGSDGSALLPCASAPRCDAGQLPVRVQIPALGQVECGCVANPCDGGFATCDCAQPVCASFHATCAGYMPDSGYLVCTTPG